MTKMLCVTFVLAGLLRNSSSPPQADVSSARISVAKNAPCEKEQGYHKLDFWVGQWNVTEGTEKAGTNLIEKILKGCAIVENWKDVEGYEGKSLFYYLPIQKEWRQVWITDLGPIKEKKLIEEFKDGGLRFQGELPRVKGGTYLDRTTLTPLAPNRVRQLIEISLDSGKSWKTTFDAIYTRAD